MIRNILFDMGGVVFHQDTAEACQRFKSIGLDTDYYMGEYGQKDFFLDLETGKINTKEFCNKLAQVIGKDSVSYEEAEYCWLGFIKDVPLNNLHYLLNLKEKYHTGLLSNTNPFIMGYTRSERFCSEKKPITHYLDSFFCSYEMHVCKPDKEIYLKTLETGNMKAEETIFVDDSLQNIEAARAIGIHGLHVKSNEDWFTPLSQLLNQL